MKLQDILNKEQYKAAIHNEGPLLILAGAGSGKTRVITYRIGYLIKECGVKPENILAVTFTNKAAEEMKARIRKVAGSDAEKIWMSTFHSLGVRILRAHSDKIGFAKNFSIFDEDDKERLMKECMHLAKISDKQIKPYEVKTRISNIKNLLLTAADYKSIARSRSVTDSMMVDIYEIYEAKMKHCNAMDFDDLIMKTVELLKKRPEVLEYYREKFKYILIDEYQDINNSQYTMISMIAEKYKNICVVGDDDQSIYRFRGADITNILDFEKDYPKATVIRLEQNYRSTKLILDAAHSVISRNAARKDKKLWTENDKGDRITFYYALDEITEADFIVNEVYRRIRETDIPLKEIAVFYRTNAQSRIIEDKFRRAGIRYRLVGGLQFYARMEIKDLLAYLRIINNPNDIISLKRIINIPPRGIGDTTVDKIEEFAMHASLSLLDGFRQVDSVPDIKEAQKSSIKRFVSMVDRLAQGKGQLSLEELMKTIVSESGYLDYWQTDPTPKARERVDNIQELVSAIAEYEEEKEGATLEDFLNQVALMTDFDREDTTDDRVTLMTMHAAKGLEFDMVFIAGMNENIFPHRNCLEEQDGIEEERRLCYVGITRARKKLFLVSALARRQYGSKIEGNVSRFITEIPEEFLERKGYVPEKRHQEKFMRGPIEEAILDMEPTTDGALDVEVQFRPGDKVKHVKMGVGRIMKIEPYNDDLKLTILFDTRGKKVLSAKFAGLQKL